ncbi:hypothetical protein KL918_003042 [Ogataea parapolymorpha]|nr:hypothetical protein KL918_003042 [Ogataea parapolymorpha]KAG7871998.1 hypothetical protein KL916_003601 [Ogataea parapolymorpha]
MSHIEGNHNRQRDVCGEKVGHIEVEKHTVTIGDGDDNKEAGAQVCERNENPRDKAGNRADVGEPGEHLGGRVGAVEESEQGNGSCKGDRVDWHTVSGAAGENGRHFSVAGHRVQASSGGEKLRVTARVCRSEDGGIDDVVEHLDTGVLDTDHVWRAGSSAGSRVDGVHEPRVVRANNHSDNDHSNDIEKGESVDESLAGFWQIRSWGLGLGSTGGDQLRAENESKRTLDDSGPARKEFAGVSWNKVLDKGSWVFPVVETEHAVRCRCSAEENDNSNNNKTDDGDNLDGGDPELDLAEEFHRAEIERHARDPEDGNKDGHVGIGPVLDHKGGGSHFGRRNQCLGVIKVQAGSKCKRLVARVALTQSVHRGLAGNGDIRNHFAELVHDAPDEERQNQVADQQACGSARRQRRAGTDKDTRSDGSSERDQLDVSALETTVDLGELLFLGHHLLGEEVIGLANHRTGFFREFRHWLVVKRKAKRWYICLLIKDI